MKKNTILSLILFFIFIVTPIFVSSAEIEIQVTPIKNLILPNEYAQFEVLVVNHQDKIDRFRFSTNDIDWNIQSEEGVLEVTPSSTRKTIIKVIPIGEKQTSAYSIKLDVYSQETGVSEKEELIIRAVQYKDLISTKLEVPPAGLDVTKSSILTLKLINKHKIELKDLKIQITSDIFQLERKLDLKSIETKESKFPLKLDKQTNEGIYDAHTLITMQGKILTDKIENINVGPYSNVKQIERKEGKFLLSKTIVTKENLGNSNVYETSSKTLSSFAKSFTNFDPEPTTKIGKTYEWEFSLKPGESYTITTTTNYRKPILYLIILIIIIWLVYGFIKNPVSIKKKVLTIKTGEGISEMKVLLLIKNNSQNDIKDVKIMDTLPKIVKEPTEFGTLKPKILTKENHKKLLWEIPTLIKGEERILSYKIKSKIKVIGKLIIPPTVCSYRRKKGKRIIVNSNRTILFS